MTKKLQVYKCEICGNIVEVLDEGAGTLVCCGKAMTLLNENSVEASKEKHIPFVNRIKDGENEKIEVQVGEILHPMTEEHYIEWIELITEKEVLRKNLKPREEPKAIFNAKDFISVRVYCNLHGLWVFKK
ncbi:desulfoferrodoxin [Candidatus Woesearchaeota archaeon]|nr:desulfoferrodoxin [Candidatus Woesearchaeota archaeon]